MPEVRQEVIVLTAVVVTALVAFIGMNAMFPAAKQGFSVKKSTAKPKMEQGHRENRRESEEKINAPNLTTLKDDETMRGKILEK